MKMCQFKKTDPRLYNSHNTQQSFWFHRHLCWPISADNVPWSEAAGWAQAGGSSAQGWPHHRLDSLLTRCQLSQLTLTFRLSYSHTLILSARTQTFHFLFRKTGQSQSTYKTIFSHNSVKEALNALKPSKNFYSKVIDILHWISIRYLICLRRKS